MKTNLVDIYNMTHDTNFAPHHDGQIMSLACCMVEIRKRVGEMYLSSEDRLSTLNYWVVGRVGSQLDRSKRNQLVYFMRVTKIMTFDCYNKKFVGRKDDLYEYRADCNCDTEFCEHKLNPKNYHQHTKQSGHTADHDIGKGHYVLLSNDYCYYNWRNNDKKVPNLETWGIPELRWIPPDCSGPFYRKFNFRESKKITRVLEKLKAQRCERYLPNLQSQNNCGLCGNSTSRGRRESTNVC